MGNRAVLTFSTAPEAPCIYLHWNGGRASVEGFLKAARELKLHRTTQRETLDAIAEVIARSFFGCKVGLTVYREKYGEADTDNGDNGVYLLSDTPDLYIIGRLYQPPREEVNGAKTRDICAQIMEKEGNGQHLRDNGRGSDHATGS